MKTIKYLLIVIFGAALFTSCEKDEKEVYQIEDQGVNIVGFTIYKTNYNCDADGAEYSRDIQVFITGPVMDKLENDVTITLVRNDSSTAIPDVHYRIENPTITLTKDQNYLGVTELIMISEGNAPPIEGQAGYEEYEAPILYLNVTDVSGDESVIATGKSADFTLNFVPPNPYQGMYDAYIKYFHPDAGGSHPANDGDNFDPNDPYSEETNEKELVAITGRKCETGFAVWPTTDICWITVNADNSLTFEVWDTWEYAVSLGDTFFPEHVSYYDPATGQIYMYYSYSGATGVRFFWEIFTPK